ncbi:hypothetical protein AKO1_006296 [Acrasis kona]|uniref:Uncharacterized protein n=1 Tax=Acrasis kona TaxID=1008807 RepID=A0AAW2YHE8_9EUKA
MKYTLLSALVICCVTYVTAQLRSVSDGTHIYTLTYNKLFKHSLDDLSLLSSQDSNGLRYDVIHVGGRLYSFGIDGLVRVDPSGAATKVAEITNNMLYIGHESTHIYFRKFDSDYNLSLERFNTQTDSFDNSIAINSDKDFVSVANNVIYLIKEDVNLVNITSIDLSTFTFTTNKYTNIPCQSGFRQTTSTKNRIILACADKYTLYNTETKTYQLFNFSSPLVSSFLEDRQNPSKLYSTFENNRVVTKYEIRSESIQVNELSINDLSVLSADVIWDSSIYQKTIPAQGVAQINVGPRDCKISNSTYYCYKYTSVYPTTLSLITYNLVTKQYKQVPLDAGLPQVTSQPEPQPTQPEPTVCTPCTCGEENLSGDNHASPARRLRHNDCPTCKLCPTSTQPPTQPPTQQPTQSPVVEPTPKPTTTATPDTTKAPSQHESGEDTAREDTSSASIVAASAIGAVAAAAVAIL